MRSPGSRPTTSGNSSPAETTWCSRSRQKTPTDTSSASRSGAVTSPSRPSRSTHSFSADLLAQPDENALGASDVAEPIHVFVLDHFVDEPRAVREEPGQRIVEVVHREHDAGVAERVYRRVPVVRGGSRREKAREF